MELNEMRDRVKTYEEQFAIAHGSVQRQFQDYKKGINEVHRFSESRVRAIAAENIQKWKECAAGYAQDLAAHNKRWLFRLLRPNAFYSEEARLQHAMEHANKESTRHEYQLSLAVNEQRDERLSAFEAAIKESPPPFAFDSEKACFVRVTDQETAERITAFAKAYVQRQETKDEYIHFCRLLGREPLQMDIPPEESSISISIKERLGEIKKETRAEGCVSKPAAAINLGGR